MLSNISVKLLFLISDIFCYLNNIFNLSSANKDLCMKQLVLIVATKDKKHTNIFILLK